MLAYSHGPSPVALLGHTIGAALNLAAEFVRLIELHMAPFRQRRLVDHERFNERCSARDNAFSGK